MTRAECRLRYLLCVSRLPSDAERMAVLELLQSRREKLADGWLDARAITTGDPDSLPELPPKRLLKTRLPGRSSSRVLLNLDETISKN